MYRGTRWGLLVLGALFALVALVVLQQRLRGGKGMPAYSIYSNESDGLALAANLYRALGWDAVALTRPIHHTRHRGVLFMVAPYQTDSMLGVDGRPTEEDARGILNWVAAGNTLVLASSRHTELHSQLKIRLVIAAAEEARPERMEVAEVGGYTDPAEVFPTLPVRSIVSERGDGIAAKDGLPLWSAGKQPGAVLLPHGQGRVLVLADPSVWTARGLLQPDNALLLYNIAVMDAAAGRIYFDEYHHGLRSGGGWLDYLRYHDLHWIALQLILVVGVAVWAVALRLGPATPLPRPLAADAVVFATAVAQIYRRAGMQLPMAQHLARDFWEALTKQLHLRRSATVEAVLQAWQRQHSAEATAQLRELLEWVEMYRRPAEGLEPPPRQELLLMAQQLAAVLGKDDKVTR